MDRILARIGGDYLTYRALQQDARAFEDVLLVIAGEDDARKILDLESKVKASRGA